MGMKKLVLVFVCAAAGSPFLPSGASAEADVSDAVLSARARAAISGIVGLHRPDPDPEFEVRAAVATELVRLRTLVARCASAKTSEARQQELRLVRAQKVQLEQLLTELEEHVESRAEVVSSASGSSEIARLRQRVSEVVSAAESLASPARSAVALQQVRPLVERLQDPRHRFFDAAGDSTSRSFLPMRDGDEELTEGVPVEATRPKAGSQTGGGQ